MTGNGHGGEKAGRGNRHLVTWPRARGDKHMLSCHAMDLMDLMDLMTQGPGGQWDTCCHVLDLIRYNISNSGILPACR